MEFNFEHDERKQMRRMTEFEDDKRSLPKSKPKPSVELPFDVMVSILIRLPAKQLRRMRSVCPSWNLLISNSHFIRGYSKFRASVTKKPYIISLHRICQWQNGCRLKFLEGDDDHSEFNMCMDFVGDQFCAISNSCDGLICVAGPTLTYLVNPSIQKERALMRRSWHYNMPNIHSAGLGFNDSTGEYKVVRLFHHKAELRCEVHTVGNLHSPSYWKAIDDPPLKPSCDSLPVFVNSTIHWTVSNRLDGVPPEIALSFDVKSEKFDLVLHPEGSFRPPCSRVVELGGLLSAAGTHPDGVRMDIWVLKDYDNRKWIKQYNIDLSAMCCSTRIAFLTIPVAIHDGKIVFCSRYGDRDYYDLQSKSFVKHTSCGGRDYYDLHSNDFVRHARFFSGFAYDTAYTESIVWPLAPTFFSGTT